MIDRSDALRQHAAFALFIEATARACRSWAQAMRPPVDLLLRDDLRSRLGWGDVFQLHAVSEADCRAAIRHRPSTEASSCLTGDGLHPQPV